MALREFVLHNFRWKLTALVLAMLVWFVIKFAIYKESTAGSNQTLAQHRIAVLQAADDPRVFRLVPSRVDLVVQATKELRPEDVEVFVDLSSIPDMSSVFKQVQVRSSEGIKVAVVAIKPWGVTVEQIGPGESSLTNSSLRKP